MGYAIGMLAALVLGLAAAVWVVLGRLEFLESGLAVGREIRNGDLKRILALEALGRDGDGVLIAPSQVAKEVAYQLITLRGRLEALEAQLLRIQEEQARQVQGSR